MPSQLFHYLIGFIYWLCLDDVAKTPQHRSFSAHVAQIGKYVFFHEDILSVSNPHSSGISRHLGRLYIENGSPYLRSLITHSFSSR